jgi:tRNA nucleotidyltransferase (CCA-adding enzyme)
LKKPFQDRPKSKPPLVLEKSAGAVVFHRNAQIEYLLLRANHWEFPKGLIDPHEEDEDAAVREVREETALAITIIPPFRETLGYFYRRRNPGALVKKQVVYFLGEASALAFTLSWEHREARWVDFDGALDLLEYENLRDLLRLAHAFVLRLQS